MQVKSEKETFVSPYPIGSRVHHATFGNGTVQEAYRENGNEKIVIRFDQAGSKTMIIKFAKLERI